MTKTALVASTTLGFTAGPSTNTMPVGLVGHPFVTTIEPTDDTTVAVVMRTAGTFSKLYCRLSANAVVGTTTLRFRKNNTNGTGVVSIGSSATGEFVDGTANTDTVVAGDKIAGRFTAGDTTHSMTVQVTSILFDATNGNALSKFAFWINAPQSPSTTFYFHLNGNSDIPQTTEANSTLDMQVAGTFKNSGFFVSTNGITSASTYTFRKNAAATAITVSVPASTGGTFEDTTHSVTIAVGDDVCHQMVTGAGGTNINIFNSWIEFEDTTTSPAAEGLAIWDLGQSLTHPENPNVTVYSSLAGQRIWPGQTSETNTKMTPRYDATFSKLASHITANSVTAASTIRLRVNSVDMTNILSIGSSATGFFTDTTSSHTDSALASDEVVYKIVTGATGTSITPAYIHVLSRAVQTRARTLSDTLSKSESAIKKSIKLRSDTMAKSETTIKKAIKVRSDTMAKSETVTKSARKLSTDTYTKSESLGFQKILGVILRTLSDTSGKSESLVKKAIKIKSDTLSNSETVTKSARKIRSLSDTLGKSEALIKAARKILSDTLSKSESILKKALKLKSDTLSNSESLTKAARKIRALTPPDTYGKSESTAKRVSLRRTDSASNSDSITKIRTTVRSLTDSLGKSDGLSRRVTKLLSDTYGSTELLRKKGIKSLADTLGKSESLSGSKVVGVITRTLSDTYGFTEQIIKSTRKGIIETYGTSQVLLKRGIKGISDVYGRSETLQKLSSHIRQITDTYGFSEQLLKSTRKLLSDISLGKSESLTGSRIGGTIVRTLTDTYTKGELLTKAVIHYITDVIGGGGGGFKQFIHQLNETYLVSETLTSFVISAQSAMGSVGSRIQEVAQNVRITLQGRQSMQAPRSTLSTRIPVAKTVVVRSLTDILPASESIQTNVYRERISSSSRVVDTEGVIPTSTSVRQLPAAEIIRTIVKTIKDTDPESARLFEQRIQVKENREKELRAIIKLQESVKVVSKDNPDLRMLKSKKVGLLMKLTKLIDLIRRVGVSS